MKIDSAYSPAMPRQLSPEDLKGSSATAYKIALLAPKLIFSGAGWVLGAFVGGFFTFGFGVSLGAGIGDSIGTLFGCAISLGLEIFIRKHILHDPTLEKNGALWALSKERSKSALILATGSLFAGITFSYALQYVAPLASVNSFVQSLITGIVTSVAFLLGMTSARSAYTISALTGEKKPNKELKCSWKNLKSDLTLSLGIIFPAQAAFVATALPVFGTTWLLGSNTASAWAKGAVAVTIGGIVGALTNTLAKAIPKIAACWKRYNQNAINFIPSVHPGIPLPTTAEDSGCSGRTHQSVLI